MKKPPVAAFTLVECVLAIGLVSFALVAVIGLMPVALRVLQDSSRDTVQAHMLGTVIADFRAQSFDTVAAKQFFFDENGVLLDSSNGARFVANAFLPGTASTNLFLEEASLKRVVVEVSPADPPGANVMSRDWVMLSDSGR